MTSLYQAPAGVKHCNAEIERGVLGFFLSNSSRPTVQAKISDISEECFWEHDNSRIFRVIKQLVTQGKEPSVIAVHNEDGSIAATLLTELVMESYISNIDQYLGTLQEYADIRWTLSRISGVQEKLATAKAKELIAQLSTDLIGRLRDNENETTEIKGMMGEFENEQIENAKAVEAGGLIGISFGFPILDNLISGIRAPHYIVAKAGPNVGKTAFVLSVVNHALYENKRVVLFSLEMSKFQNISRLIGMRTTLPPLEIEKGSFKNTEVEIGAKASLYQQDLTIYAEKFYIDDIVVAAHAEHSVRPIDLLVIDYIQNIAITDSRYEAYTMASQKIQQLAKRLNVPILAASQINTTGAARGSGDIDNHADFIVRLSKKEENGNVVAGELLMEVTKNRHGMIDTAFLKFSDGGELIQSSY
ncbi:MAG: DnaB-like helicase C-terminal domain-containing protein [Syntrophobacteraceae bacterium]